MKQMNFVGPSARQRWSRASLSCLMLLVAMGVAMCAFSAPAHATRRFTAAITPTTDLAGHTTTYTFTVTNTSTASETMGSSIITIPTGYTSVTPGATSASGGKSWTAVIVGNTIEFRGANGFDKISVNQSASLSFTAKAPVTGGTYTWTTTGNTNTGTGGLSMTLSGYQPAVIVAGNHIPTAGNDFTATDEDTAVTVNAPGVLTNDTDLDLQTLTAVLLSQPAHGQVTLNADGSFTYTPNADFNGTDSFTYAANDGVADSAAATVEVTVAPVADDPVAQGDSYNGDEDKGLVVDAPGVLGNDSDVDGDALTAVLDDDVQHGTLTLNADGSFEYTPEGDFNGTDSFTYHANDGSNDSGVVTVDITVAAVNDAPAAIHPAIGDGDYVTDEDMQLQVAAAGLLDNFIDPEGDTLTAVLDTDVRDGTLNLNADGSFDYTPNSNFNGDDSFTFHANDGANDSDIVTVTINVTPVNDAPVAAADPDCSTDEDTPLNGSTVLANDTDTEGDTLSAVLDTDVSHGTLSLDKDGTFTYTPDADFNGTDSFTYKASDDVDQSDAVTVTITVNAVNDAPAATDDTASVVQDAALHVTASGVLGNDSDAEGDAITAALDADVSHGSLTFNADGSYDYTPNAGYYGTDSFTYHGNDGSADGNVATVTITVIRTYTISGLIRVGNVTPVAGVNVTRTGGVTVQTDASGHYEFTGLLPGGYMVTPASANYTFSPNSSSLTITTANRAANFIATAVVPSYNVSGRISTSNGNAVAGVSVSRTGAAGVGSPTTVTTNSAGYFTFPKVINGNYTITPSLAGYTFVPATKSVTVNGADVSNQNFVTGWSVSGRITTSNGHGIADVSVSSGTGTPVVTNSQGYYTLWGLQSGTYTVTPSKAGVTFAPTSKTVTVGTSNVANQNFIGTLP